MIELVSAAGISRILGITESPVLRLVRAGTFRQVAVMDGTRALFDAREVHEYALRRSAAMAKEMGMPSEAEGRRRAQRFRPYSLDRVRTAAQDLEERGYSPSVAADALGLDPASFQRLMDDEGEEP